MYFVEKSEEFYGKTFAVYNVHSLTHLPDDVELPEQCFKLSI